MVRPVGRSDLTLQEDQLSGFDGRAVTKCPGVIMLCCWPKGGGISNRLISGNGIISASMLV